MVWADTKIHPTAGPGDIHLFPVLFTCKVIKLYTNPWDARAFEAQTFFHLCFLRITVRQIMLGRHSPFSKQASINQQIQ